MNLLVAAGAGAALRRRRAGVLLLWAGLAGLWLFSLPVVSGSLIALLEAGLPSQGSTGSADAPQAIVILSGDQQRVWDNGRIGWRVGALTLEREAAGAVLARRTHLPVLVSGGSIRDGAPALAEQMALSLSQDFAINVQWRDIESQDTWQNAVQSAAILRPQGIGRVYVVTHAWHMRRALLAFRRAGLQAVPAPVLIDAKPDLSAGAFLPSAKAWQESYWAVHELVGWAWYALHP